MRALLVDQSRDRSALAAARMLHADGWEVGTGAWRESIASTSSITGRHHHIEEAEGDEEVVFCNYDVGLLILSRRREEIAPAVVPYARHEVVQRSFDKLAFTQ